MKATAIIILPVVISLASCGIIDHSALLHEPLQDHHHERATSYQNLHIEHFYPIPKGHEHHFKEPIPIGKTVSKVEIHHGGKHDHGWALASVHSDVHNHGHADFGASDVHLGGEEIQPQLGLEGHQYEVQGLEHYQLPEHYAQHEE